MNSEELKEILNSHEKWLRSEDGGKRANLRDADLCGAYLCDADLRGANLCDANLRGANLCDADLRGANLCDANLRGADLHDANLRGADLCGADLCGANLRDANLRGAENIPFIPYSCPDTGSFIGYKKANGYIVELDALILEAPCH